MAELTEVNSPSRRVGQGQGGYECPQDAEAGGDLSEASESAPLSGGGDLGRGEKGGKRREGTLRFFGVFLGVFLGIFLRVFIWAFLGVFLGFLGFFWVFFWGFFFGFSERKLKSGDEPFHSFSPPSLRY